jgi:hypothetical protein
MTAIFRFLRRAKCLLRNVRLVQAAGLLGVAVLWYQPLRALANPPSSQSQACALLQTVAQAAQLAGEGLTTGRYGCQSPHETADGWVFALQYLEPAKSMGEARQLGHYLVDLDAETVTPWSPSPRTPSDTGGRLGGVAEGAVSVRACGVAFDLPSQYRITRPVRSVSRQGVRVCAFDIVPAQAAPKSLECKDEAEGGSPPYPLCDWDISAGHDWPTVQVARTRVDADRLPLDPFNFERGAWRLPNAHAQAALSSKVPFFGRQARHGEVLMRAAWHRTKAQPAVGMQAGTSSADAYLLQLTPQLAVVLVSPPLDSAAHKSEGVGGCHTFCRSLRAAGRPSEEP